MRPVRRRHRELLGPVLLVLAVAIACGSERESIRVELVQGLAHRAQATGVDHSEALRHLKRRLITDDVLVLGPATAPAEVRFPSLHLPAKLVLELELLLWDGQKVPDREPTRLDVRVEARGGGGSGRVSEHSIRWIPERARWVEAELHVEADAPIEELVLSASFPDGEVDPNALLVVLRPRARFTSEVEVPAPGAPEPRQVVLVTLDTLRADHMGCYGGDVATPNLDAFARGAARFEQCYATANVTKPSHASIFTSLSSFDHGVLSNRKTLARTTPSMIENLRERGFATAAFPASANFRAEHSELSRRFAEYHDFGTQQRRAEDVNRIALPWFASHAAEDFFVWIHYYDAHGPYDPPPPFDLRYWDAERFAGPPETGLDEGYAWKSPVAPEHTPAAHALYKGEISYLDREIGSLLDGLRELRILDRALVVFTADHGEAFGELGIYADHPELSDATTHVPLLIRPPGGIDARVVGGLVSTLDVYPTIFDLLGFPVAGDLRGQSLGALIRGGGRSEQSRVFSVSARATSVSLRNAGERLTLGLAKGPPRWVPAPDGRGHVETRLMDGETELYVYSESTFEGRNLATERMDVADALRNEIAAFQSSALRMRARGIEDEEFDEALRDLGYL